MTEEFPMVQQLEVEEEKIKVKKSENVDTKELEVPDTVFVRDIENRVFQAIILQGLSQIEGISLLEGTFFDNILGKDSVKGVTGINAEQDNKNQSVNVKVEVNIRYGIPIPDKAEEIQTRITDEITSLTGLHVASVHVVFKSVILPVDEEKEKDKQKDSDSTALLASNLEEEFANEF